MDLDAPRSALPLPFAGNPEEESSADAAGQTAPLWDPASLAGRLVEVTPARGLPSAPARAGAAAMPNLWDVAPPSRDRGSAVLTAAADLVWKAQQLGEVVAWIQARASIFFPPDFDAGGIDLGALVVVRVADASSAARAADKLLRSGAFGLVLLDLGASALLPPALASRLLGLAQKHRAAVVFLTEKPPDAPSVAPVVSLRVAASRRRGAGDLFFGRIEATKDKRHAPGWTWQETFRGPPGLR